VATTTPAAFNDFKGKLLLTDDQKLLVTGRRDSVAGYVAKAFPSTSTMPVSTTKLIGSAGRATIIRPLDDVDVLAVFENKDNIFETYRYDSQAFLYRVRDGLKQYSTVKVIGARGQAVRFFYTQAPHVDVAPVFKWRGNDTGYALPDGSGGWLTTDPDAHAAFMVRRNTELGLHLKPLVRMLKRWNNEHSKYLKSFHLEVMVQACFGSLGADSRLASERFFDWGQRWIDVSDPAGHGGVLSNYLTAAKRQALLTNMQSAQTRASNANAVERDGDHKEAIRLWRIIYGDEFPTYG
jgi:hypothetical protein